MTKPEAGEHLKTSIHTESGVTVVDISGRIVGGADASLLRERIKWVLTSAGNIVLNFSGITFIDSAGLGVLVSLWTSSRNSGKALRFAAVKGRVKQLLDITRLSNIFDIYENVDQAVNAPAKNPAKNKDAQGAGC